MNGLFRHIAERTAQLVGTPWAFIVAVIVIIAWAASGPLFGYSNTWQLVVNTGTTIVTFLIVFLIQNTQNRESRIRRVPAAEREICTADRGRPCRHTRRTGDETSEKPGSRIAAPFTYPLYVSMWTESLKTSPLRGSHSQSTRTRKFF